MIIIGIDPGIAIVGFGVIEYKGNHFRVISHGAVTTSAGESLPTRLEIIYNSLTELLEKYRPDAMAIEELFFNKNTKTAFMVAQARGVAILAASLAKLDIYEYTPLQVKQGVVGYGRADKKQMQTMVKTILNLEKVPKPDDVADALAVAVCHAHSGVFGSMFKIK
ncbi:crossover junction endodeoxyribonuclease RuvC [Geosporobacter ferrireducens]|uniref:Crossover junction endodeoxyribonuclease RuvC n=1 Tax=Geosporobacter ferrireducens TaxID=1424294 RepID=A0A1D8GQW5_9FIRM|nr:crossover junction endodeoxyribonuclease RuvC [Geosporobacter ferrireducens]AOT73320.1 crossover junction endodeoxyribonuclease RuvC [Geosporobacter ferrireducens]MTI55209.1 crossover junction endodeoxyribonuclease RuvC [Geosporobacter ferrireducens]